MSLTRDTPTDSLRILSTICKSNQGAGSFGCRHHSKLKYIMEKIKLTISKTRKSFKFDELAGKLTAPDVTGTVDKVEAHHMNLDNFITRYLSVPTFPHKIITLLNYYRRNEEGLEMLNAKPAQFKVLHNTHYCYPYDECMQRYGNLIITLRACAIENRRTYLPSQELIPGRLLPGGTVKKLP